MEDTRSQARVTDETSTDRQADESRDQQAAAVTVARMLANPRRVRRA